MTPFAADEEVFDQLAHLVGDAERRAFFERRPELATAARLEQLCAEVNRQVGISSQRAIELAGAALFLASQLAAPGGAPGLLALPCRAAANAFHFAGRSEEAQELYDRALRLFEEDGDRLGAAITRSSALTNLAYLGELDRVRRFEAEARAVFEERGDRLRLAILDNNLANILTRQDRWREALERYRAAHGEFVRQGRAQDAAICLRNVASCLVCLHHFQEALEVYRQSREFCLAEGLERLVVEADYNIAYLYFLRGEYTAAIALYERARADSARAGDAYHQALCDLDLSEIYLELNLAGDAARLAEGAHLLFGRLKMAYESAKALTHAALAESRSGGGMKKALGQLAEARRIFEREGNRLWPALLDFYRAVLLGRAGRPAEAEAAAGAAHAAFAGGGVPHRAVLCQILLAALLLDQDRAEEAGVLAGEALAALGQLELPALEQLAWRLAGRSEERRGAPRAALAAYRQALARLEQLRGQLLGEDLKIAFLQDKRDLYEGLFRLTLDEAAADAEALALGYAEQAKSRSLLELLAFRAASLPSRRGSPELSARTRELREELSFHYRQLDKALMDGGGAEGPAAAAGEIARLRAGARRHEDELLRHLRRLQMADGELGSLQAPAPFDLAACRAALEPGTALVDYFLARGEIFAAVVLPGALSVHALGSEARCRERYRLLQFELSRCAPGRPGPAGLAPWIDRAVEGHLRALGQLLLAPLLGPLAGCRGLVLAPHGFLHYVPFHALEIAPGEALIDRFEISYTPSAAVFQLGQAKAPAAGAGAHLLGVADQRAPQIAAEIAALAEVLPAAVVSLGEQADEAALRRASGSRFVHVATHAVFRRDNPMFSAIQLGRSRLSLFDLYDLELEADLVVLSGCGTGLSAVLGADELVGLARGLLYAGARSLLLSLWDVADQSTAELMVLFYRELQGDDLLRPAAALRRALLRHRERHPRPYHWAPFVLIGRP